MEKKKSQNDVKNQMDRQVRKLKTLFRNHLHQSKEELQKIFGTPNKDSYKDVWFFSRRRWGIFRDDITFIFEEDKVADIMLTRNVLGMEYKNIFYSEGSDPEYKIK